VTLLSRSASHSPKLLRALGVGAAALWAFLGLADRTEWPYRGVVALGAWVAAAVLVKPAVAVVPNVLLALQRRVFVAACAFVAGGVSWWVVRRMLRDMPLSIDAGVYLMQARAMAHLHFGASVSSPLQAFGNRFVLEGPDRRLYGIFPPGWPLAMVPFVWLGAPMLVGPAVAALLVVAQAALGRAMARASADDESAEVATRASLLLTLPSYARAIETADALSHAFIALLAAMALACAIDLRCAHRDPCSPTRGKGLMLGACVGWAIAARLLDGAVLALAVAGVLAWSPAGRRAVAWAALGAAPFLLLLAVEQRCATGAWLVPTQTAYFARADWPPSCHRLGLGVDVGCTVEHPDTVATFGPNGYGLREAQHVIRERAGALGEDLLGFPPLALLVFASVAVGGSGVDAVGIAFVLALTLTYGLFYYGNGALYGARHLFPAAPFVWLAAARGARWLVPRRTGGWLDAAHARGAGVVILLGVATVCARGPWATRGAAAEQFQASRSDLRRALAARGTRRGILKTRDQTSVAAAVDPWKDGDERLFVLDDGSGVVELRRAHPALPFMLSLAHEEIGTLYVRPPAPGVFMELESAWPSFQRPAGLRASRVFRDGASGRAVLFLTHARPGAEVAIPFEVAVSGDYALRVDGFAGPDQGDYALVLDGESLPDWRGYAPEPASVRGEVVKRTLTATRHTLVARCLGRDDRSRGYDATFDALVGEPALK
jgi:hypothetical protein